MIRKISMIALILLLVGVIGSVFTFSTKRNQAEIVDEKVIISNDFNNIELYTDNAEISLLPTDEDAKIELSGNNDSRYKLTTDVEGDTLKVSVKTANKLFSIGFFPKGLSLKVYVPQHVYESIYVKSDNGKINITEIEGNTIQAETDNGKIELRNITTKVIEADTDNGRIEMENIDGEIIGETSNGRISLATDHLDRPIELHSDNGRVEIQSKNKPTNAVLDLKTENGEVSVFGKSDWNTVIGEGENLIKITTDNGRISLSN